MKFRTFDILTFDEMRDFVLIKANMIAQRLLNMPCEKAFPVLNHF